MIRILFIALALCAGCTALSAQNLDAFKARLSRADSLSSARVTVSERGTAAAAVRALQARVTDNKVKGYRVRIFFDNSQSARGQAAEAMSRFRDLYPGIPAYMSYENPYFKVTVGNCVTIEEAIILKGRIESVFNRAFISREDIPLSKLAD